MRRLLIAIPLLIPALAAGQFYKWVDAQGNVQYTDHPVPGAEAVSVPIRKAPPPSDRNLPGQPYLGPYVQFDILTPEPNASVLDADGNVQVGLVLDPTLLPGQRLQLLLDGAPVNAEVPGTQLTIPKLPFDAHELRARLIDAAETPIAASSIVRFHVRKPESP